MMVSAFSGGDCMSTIALFGMFATRMAYQPHVSGCLRREKLPGPVIASRARDSTQKSDSGKRE